MMKRSILSLITILSVAFLTYSHVVRAECNVNGAPGNSGTSGNDTIVCDNTPPASTIDGVGGEGGSDAITVDEGATVSTVAGDARGASAGIIAGPDGSAAPDTIVVGGTVGAVYGDYTNDFNGADDSITVTSTGRVSSIVGDSANGLAFPVTPEVGSDTIVVDAGGVVDGDIWGDNAITHTTAVGGNDNITVNGTVANDVQGEVGNDTITVGGTVSGTVDGGLGDDNVTVNGAVGNVQGQEGNDTVTVSGTVNGSINGGSGDDSVTLNDGANGGADSDLAVNGGDGNDTLTFAFTISSQDDYDALASLIAANAPSGSITINGQTITWSNFEQLVNALIANFSVGTKVSFKDNRLNSTDAGASALAYCSGSGVQVLKVDPVTAQGSEAFTVTIAQIQAALAKAQSSNTNVEITTAAGVTLSATPDGKLVVTAPDIGDTSKTYEFSFDAGVCV